MRDNHDKVRRHLAANNDRLDKEACGWSDRSECDYQKG
jgi:hypothetical protein